VIRPATKEDVAQAVPLLLLAMGSIGNMLAGTADDEVALTILLEFFQQEANRLSYQNTLVAERDGRVVGALVSYHGSRCEELDRPFLAQQRARYGQVYMEIPREARSDEYYLDSLAVAEEYRGQGIATALISAFEIHAVMRAYDKVALLAEESNAPAYRLYRRLGYEADSTLNICGHDFHHMIKRLKRAMYVENTVVS
jgi:ribosomal protein S18 acetylase RimI-like enzyme